MRAKQAAKDARLEHRTEEWNPVFGKIRCSIKEIDRHLASVRMHGDLTGLQPFQPLPADAAIADDRQRVFPVEPRADAVHLQRAGIHFATLVEEHRSRVARAAGPRFAERSEEHTSELQSL